MLFAAEEWNIRSFKARINAKKAIVCYLSISARAWRHELFYIIFLAYLAQAEPCGCWNTTEDGREVEVECKCGGPRLTLIPADLPKGVQRMWVVWRRSAAAAADYHSTIAFFNWLPPHCVPLARSFRHHCRRHLVAVVAEILQQVTRCIDWGRKAQPHAYIIPCTAAGCV